MLNPDKEFITIKFPQTPSGFTIWLKAYLTDRTSLNEEDVEKIKTELNEISYPWASYDGIAVTC